MKRAAHRTPALGPKVHIAVSAADLSLLAARATTVRSGAHATGMAEARRRETAMDALLAVLHKVRLRVERTEAAFLEAAPDAPPRRASRGDRKSRRRSSRDDDDG